MLLRRLAPKTAKYCILLGENGWRDDALIDNSAPSRSFGHSRKLHATFPGWIRAHDEGPLTSDLGDLPRKLRSGYPDRHESSILAQPSSSQPSATDNRLKPSVPETSFLSSHSRARPSYWLFPVRRDANLRILSWVSVCPCLYMLTSHPHG